ncbi:MAG: hypothetical protein CEN90_486 [Parcubacteria group bacterium Licking1014_17]|nr:MAG: hypothetical protein CEN90_486 [Parcubacteria group bacterium Licking1014_17]
MSGHSKWSQIKHKKGVSDQKRGQLFSKISRLITVAAKDGDDPSANARLQDAIEQARVANVPKENIERAIKRAREKESAALNEMIIQATGPQSIALIIKAITDNKNRTINEIKGTLSENGFKVANEGSLDWLFEKKAVIAVSGQFNEDLELGAIENGADDIKKEDELIIITGKSGLLHQLQNFLKSKGVHIESAEIGYVPKDKITVSDDKVAAALDKVYESLDNHNDVDSVYTNTSN